MATAYYPSGETSLKSRPFGDPWLIVSAAALIGFGFLALYGYGLAQGNPSFFHKQMFNVALGLIPATILAVVDPKVWFKASNVIYVVNILALLAVLKFGVSKNGSARWINIGPIDFQPSEMAKLALILTVSTFFVKRRESANSIWTFLASIAHVGLPMILIAKQPHLMAALVIGLIWASICLTANLPFKFIGGASAVAALLLLLMFFFPTHFSGFIHGYHTKRVEAFMGSPGKSDENYQTSKAEIAFGVGGITGSGLGKSSPGGAIPEQETDFVFTVIGEQFGLVGGLAVLATFGFFLYRLWLVVLHAEDRFHRLLATGILTLLGLHTFINLMMVTMLLPVIGLWLPFMSYGGTAMWLCMSCVGLALNIQSREKSSFYGT